jgi:hypothetical protein
MTRFRWLIVLALTACGPFRSGRPTAPAGCAEFTTTVRMPSRADSTRAELCLPLTVKHVSAVVVIRSWGPTRYLYDHGDWRAMCARANCALLRLTFPVPAGTENDPSLNTTAEAGGGEGLLISLRQLAAISAHPELEKANLLLWGFSAAGAWVTSFANRYPERTIGIIRYHSTLMRPFDSIAGIPTLILAGSDDSVPVDSSGSPVPNAFWVAGRRLDAPWSYVLHPGQGHYSLDGLEEASPLMLSWVEGVLHLRVSDSSRLRGVSVETGFLLGNNSGEVERRDAFKGNQTLASWLPDQASAEEWRQLHSRCEIIGLQTARELLGSSARVTQQQLNFCEYVADVANVKSRLLIGHGTRSNAAETTKALRAYQARVNGVDQPNLGDGAFVIAEGVGKCSQIHAWKGRYAVQVNLCGPQYGTNADFSTLKQLTAKLFGLPSLE